jgi:hypothetical protein
MSSSIFILMYFTVCLKILKNITAILKNQPSKGSSKVPFGHVIFWVENINAM